MQKPTLISGAIWASFATLLVAATAPIWQRAVYGF
jgi:hypothetical protein